MTINIVFDGPPGPEGPRFVEVENTQGQSIKIGEWHERADGFWELRIPLEQPVTPSEAVAGFAAWASTRDGTVLCGAEHECTPLIDLVLRWCQANKWARPREGIFPDNLKVPENG